MIEVHGTVHEYVCLGCGRGGPMQVRAGPRARRREDPPCLDCGGILKSATISFGQALVPDVIARAMDRAAEADLLVAIGSTLQVYPVASVVPHAKDASARIIARECRADAVRRSG